MPSLTQAEIERVFSALGLADNASREKFLRLAGTAKQQETPLCFIRVDDSSSWSDQGEEYAQLAPATRRDQD